MGCPNFFHDCMFMDYNLMKFKTYTFTLVIKAVHFRLFLSSQSPYCVLETSEIYSQVKKLKGVNLS